LSFNLRKTPSPPSKRFKNPEKKCLRNLCNILKCLRNICLIYPQPAASTKIHAPRIPRY